SLTPLPIVFASEESLIFQVALFKVRLLLKVRVPGVETLPGLTTEPETAVTLLRIVPNPAKVSPLCKLTPPGRFASRTAPLPRLISEEFVIALAAPSTREPALINVTPE